MSLSGRTALVTGASRGIGASIAKVLAAAGVRVALLARTRPLLEDVAGRIDGQAIVVDVDLSDEAATSAAATLVRGEFGGAPDFLVNNAGIFRVAGLDSMKAAEFGVMLRTNLFAPFLMFSEFLADMRSRGSGHVVTIGSVADRAIFPGNGAYSATKFGMRAVHEVLREETRGSGVKATLISPAGVDTDIWDDIRFPGVSEPPDRKAMLSPYAVAGAVLFALTQPQDVNIDELRLSKT